MNFDSQAHLKLDTWRCAREPVQFGVSIEPNLIALSSTAQKPSLIVRIPYHLRITVPSVTAPAFVKKMDTYVLGTDVQLRFTMPLPARVCRSQFAITSLNARCSVV